VRIKKRGKGFSDKMEVGHQLAGRLAATVGLLNSFLIHELNLKVY
jgi:hypothetical protein